MSYRATIVLDSIARGVRLTTMEVVMPRMLLAEFNTHRVFSRNSASSRAIPVERRIQQVREYPFVPDVFGVNRRGMQATETLDERDGSKARDVWMRACSAALEQADALCSLGVHKQHANRLLEPFVWHTVLVSSTEWANFYELRDHRDAQPEMQRVARLMREAQLESEPTERSDEEWHLPYVSEEDRNHPLEIQRRISVVRCAAVSFERQHAQRDIAQVMERSEALIRSAHWSPLEHQAQVDHKPHAKVSNFRWPWLQHRKMHAGERVFGG